MQLPAHLKCAALDRAHTCLEAIEVPSTDEPYTASTQGAVHIPVPYSLLHGVPPEHQQCKGWLQQGLNWCSMERHLSDM